MANVTRKPASNVVPIESKRKAAHQLMFMHDDLVVDSFAGGGGASTGIESALGRAIDIAINHSADAIGIHSANHPDTHHYIEDVYDVDPVIATQGKRVALAWFSPDCRHFSRAKGSKPVEKNIRGLAWVANKWAETVRPTVIVVENVSELKTWGPLRKRRDAAGCVLLDAKGQPQMEPDPKRAGETYRSWIRQFERLGYTVEAKELRACDYGAPTIRKRLFVIARCDGLAIRWPAPTHGDPKSKEVQSGKLLPWRTAAECIDFSIDCPSIFTRKKPLADTTMRRIAKGLQRYVIESDSPFIVQTGDAEILLGASLAQTGNGERAGQAPRAMSLDKPLNTVVGAGKHALATAQLRKIDQCSMLVDIAHGEVSPGGVKRWGTGAKAIDKPLGTVVGSGNAALVTAMIVKHYGEQFSGKKSAAVTDPLPTVTARSTQVQLVTSNLIKLRGANVGQAVDAPLATISAQGTHHAEVRTFLRKFLEADEGADSELGIVRIRGELYQIVDIGMRMLSPRELMRAQGFPEDYKIDATADGRPLTKTAQIRMCGNSVCPPAAEAVVRANAPAAAFENKRQAA